MPEVTTPLKDRPEQRQLVDYIKPLPVLAAGILLIIIGLVIGLVGLLGKGPAASLAASPNLTTVSITQQGFQPASVTVPPNTVVAWTSNDSSATHIIASNPYPKDGDTPGLKSTQLGVGAQYRYKFAHTGTYRYHDDLNPTLNGTVTVK